MPKAKTRKPRKAVAARRPARKTSSAPRAVEMSAEEVAALELSATERRKIEQAWLNMSAPPEEEERWAPVDERPAKSRERGPSLRRWKFFSK